MIARPRFIILILFTFMFLLMLLQILLTDNLTAVQVTYAQVIEKEAYYRTKNMSLENQILTKESLLYISNEARKEGFVSASYYFLQM